MTINNMYYPILRARQFELIALRELAENKKTQKFVTPILEPVRTSFNGLNIAHKILKQHKQFAYLIVNPEVGETGYGVSYLEYLKKLGDDRVYLPAFRYDPEIQDNIQQYNLNDCLLICDDDIDDEDTNFKELAKQGEVSKFGIYGTNRNRSLVRYLKSLQKPCIRIDDLFKKEQRNSDYLEIDAHKFSEEHLYFNDEGFNGFSDYTIIPSEYNETGSMPRAVVIHLTYLKENEQIWIRHFTSTTNDSQANVQGKFAEAAKKAVDFCKSEGLNNLAIRELTDIFNKHHYPGLGVNKKIAIKNHILVVAKYLGSKS